jgi:cellulose synthase/poly-beta-1,6-N-acetylglucosamine synthase-like glycosyltransferase
VVASILLGLTAIAASVLFCFAMRRIFFALAAVLPRRPAARRGDELPAVTLLIAAHNEAAGIDRTLQAVDQLDYPPGKLRLTFVDDCSDDGTPEHFARWAAGRPFMLLLKLPARVGKPQALNAALEVAPPTELVAVCDADVRPRRGWLRHLVKPFLDDTVGAAAGFLAPENARANPIACYAAVESWVHQLVTSAGKDRLDLNPPALGGGSMFRRTALEKIGRFGQGLSGDDVRATVALTRAGWRTRFVPEAVADNAVVDCWADYWCQHIRWGRDLFATAACQHGLRGVRVPLARRLEAWMLTAGYADRIALLVALLLATIGRLPFWVPAAYLAITAVEVCIGVAKAGAARRLPVILFWTGIFFAFDVVTSAAAAAAHVLRQPRTAPSARLAKP